VSDLPQANPVPTKPPLHLKGGYLVVAVPENLTEAAFCVPAVRALRHGRPNGTLTVVTPAENEAFWQGVGGIDHVVGYPKKASTAVIVELIRNTGVTYESSFAWAAGPAATAFAKLKIGQRLGVPAPGLSGKLTDPVAVSAVVGPPEHALRNYLLPLARLGFETLVPANFPVPELPPRPSPAVVAFAPSSDFGPAYRWPVEKFEEVAVTLQERHGVDLVVVNLPDQGVESRVLADSLTKRYGDLLQDCVDRFSLGELLDTLPHLSALVCSDNSLAHLAAFVGLPAVPVFGAGDEAGRRPQGRIHRVVNAHVECTGCGQSKCPLDHRCMNEVTPEMVVAAVESALGLA
jgi:heptosyltransferase-2